MFFSSKRQSKRRFDASGLVALIALSMAQSVFAAEAGTARPAAARVQVHTEIVHGVETRDPYRWMEDTKSKEFLDWAAQQQRHAEAELATAGSQEALSAKISGALQDLPTLGAIYPATGSLLVTRWLREGQEIHAVDEGSTKERTLVIAERLKAAGRGARIRRVTPSWDGRYAAISTTGTGDQAPQVSVVDVRTGELLPDLVPDLLTTTSGSRYQVTWLPDSSGFVYPRLASGALTGPSGQMYAQGRQYLHRIGTPAAADVAIFGHEVDPAIATEPDDLPSAILMSPDSPWIVARLARTNRDTNELWAARLDEVLAGKPSWQRISENGHSAPALRGDRLYAITSLGADRRQIVSRALGAADSTWNTIVAERPGVIREFILSGGDTLYFTELREARDWLYRIGMDGSAETAIDLPLVGSIRFAPDAARSGGLWFEASNWVNPGGWFRVAADSRHAVALSLDPGSAAPTTDDLVIEQLMLPASDGVRVPVSIVRPRDRKLDGSMPLLLEAYGSFAKIQAPEFNPYIALWVRQGAAYAYAHVRGGGELGEAWHRAALRENKSTTARDVIDVAQALVERGYTTPEKTILLGMSNGAQPAGMALTMRPQQFGVVVYNVGQPDDLRGSRIDPTSARNLGELGDTRTKEGVELLVRNSPYYQLPDRVKLPVVVVKSAPDDYNYGSAATTAKYVARLQAANEGDRPVLWLHQTGGHSWLFDDYPDRDARLMMWLLKQVASPP